MGKIDFKKTLKEFYGGTDKNFAIVEVPRLQFVMVDGEGAPGNDTYALALKWLYAISYGLKFMSKNDLGKDYVVSPLEGLWWADDMSVFRKRSKDQWLWTMMLMQPDWIDAGMFEHALDKAKIKFGEPPASLRLAWFEEGLSVQILHIGPYADEGPVIARLHESFLPENNLVENGHHHEIYLGDPRRTAPEKLKTILRHPVKRVGAG